METIPKQDEVVKDPPNIYEDMLKLDTKAVMSASVPLLIKPKMLDDSLLSLNSLLYYLCCNYAAIECHLSEILVAKLAIVFDFNIFARFKRPCSLHFKWGWGGVGRRVSLTPPLFLVAALVVTAKIEIVDILNYNIIKKDAAHIPGMLGFEPLNPS